MVSNALVLPIYWVQKFKNKKDKVWLCGLNSYRNWHYHTSNKFKVEFEQLVTDQLESWSPIDNQFTLELQLYYKNPNCDGSNIIALMEKVVLDALQASDIITNDNVKYHLGSTWAIAGQDKLNPRCEITIKECNDQPNP